MNRIIIVALLALAGCSGNRPEIFDKANRAATEMLSATDVGVNYAKFGELLITLTTEARIARDAAKNPDELAAADNFRDAVAAYKDSHDAWAVKIKDGPVVWSGDATAKRLSLQYDAGALDNGNYNVETIMQAAWAVGKEHIEAAQKKIAEMK